MLFPEWGLPPLLLLLLLIDAHQLPTLALDEESDARLGNSAKEGPRIDWPELRDCTPGLRTDLKTIESIRSMNAAPIREIQSRT